MAEPLSPLAADEAPVAGVVSPQLLRMPPQKHQKMDNPNGCDEPAFEYDSSSSCSSSSSSPAKHAQQSPLVVVDDASLQNLKALEYYEQNIDNNNEAIIIPKESHQRRRRRPPPPLTSSSSSLSSVSSADSSSSSSSSSTIEHSNHNDNQSAFSTDSNPPTNLLLLDWTCLRDTIPLTTTLPLLVFIDMFAVALVVPLLVRYFQSAGITNASHRELLTSVFSVAQIVGGLVLGALMEARWVKRTTVLYVSFGGSAVAYALMACSRGNVMALMVSRILVGLVKQTMTITKTMLANCTTAETRAQHMGRLSASATASWVVGPSVGAVLFKYVDPRAPPVLASVLFLVNMGVAALLLPEDCCGEDYGLLEKEEKEDTGFNDDHPRTPTRRNHTNSNSSCRQRAQGCRRATHQANSKCKMCTLNFFSNLKSCFSSSTLAAVVCASLVVTWVTRATNSNNLSTFYEELYGLEPHQRGYISSYQQVLGLVIEAFFIAPVLKWSGGERKATCLTALLLSVAIGLQTLYKTDLRLFLGLVCPVTSLAYSIMFTSLQTLVTTTVHPAESIFSVLAAMDVLQNAVSVTVPFYRTMLFARLTAVTASSNNNILNNLHDAVLSTTTTSTTTMSLAAGTTTMEGDPDPGAWLVTCTIHWFLASAALGSFLLLYEKRWQSNKGQPKKMS